jgi:hypothetical protein
MQDDELEKLRKILSETNHAPKKNAVSRFVERVKKRISRPINQPKAKTKTIKTTNRRKPAA